MQDPDPPLIYDHHPVDTGIAVAEGLTDSAMPAISRMFAGKFVFGEQGCQPTDGVTITKADLKFGLSTLSHAVDDTKLRLEGAFMWSLGDMLVMLRDNYEDAEDIIGEAISAEGCAAESAMIAERVARHWPAATRIAGLSHTHHRELMNYPEIEPPEREKIIADVLVGNVISDVESPAGDRMIKRRALSCSIMRRMLRCAAGRTVKEIDKPIYLYLEKHGPVSVSYGPTVDRTMASRNGIVIVHLPTLKTVDPNTLTPTTDVRRIQPEELRREE